MEPKVLEKLKELAWQAHQRAYAPYSKFSVGAAILSKDGSMTSGCNVENASYGGTICAERSAIVAAVSQGNLKPGELEAVVVACSQTDDVWPCGLCRQVIEEFGHEKTVIYSYTDPNRDPKKLFHVDLLPKAFGPSHLDQ